MEFTSSVLVYYSGVIMRLVGLDFFSWFGIGIFWVTGDMNGEDEYNYFFRFCFMYRFFVNVF